jgi:hypothetical protein
MKREDLPRLTDEEREALDDHAVIAGTAEGEEPIHAKGPWRVRSTGRDSVIEADNPYIDGGAPFQVAVVTCGDFTDATGTARAVNNANAHLIAASPRLLKALKDLLVECDRNGFAEVSLDHPMVKPFFDAARDAIAAAEGRHVPARAAS